MCRPSGRSGRGRDGRRALARSFSLVDARCVSEAVTAWILDGREPWTTYRVLVDLEKRSPHDPDAVRARGDMIASREVRQLIARAGVWPGYPLRRHNDAAHPLYALSTLADFGLHRGDPGIDGVAESILEHFDGEQFETLLWLPRFLTKEADAERWAWMLCDAPTLLYALLSFGYGAESNVQAAVDALVGAADDNGWRCGAAASLGSFSGPGRSQDPCPMATVYSLKVLSLLSEWWESAAVFAGTEALLSHWDHQADYKLRMFGIGTDFRKIKYPFVWYDILHVTEVLSRFPHVVSDPRLHEMVGELQGHEDDDRRVTATSMYRAWKGWSFADKSRPSPWLTFLVERIRRRLT